MPNTLAFVVLALWPAFSLWLFARLPVGRAVIWTIVGGYMALPPIAAFDLPMMPALDKYVIANLSALMGCLIHARDQILALPRSRLVIVLLAAFVASPLATILSNGDPMYIGGGFVLPGLRLYDAISVIMSQVLFVIPFFLARAVLSTPEAHRDILRIFMLGGLIYSIPMLIEIRLSPQLNTWIYGFFQHSFDQMMRQGGFRPIVFMPHGLWVAFFAMSAVVAAAALSRDAAVEDRGRLLMVTGYLFAVLVLCKSLASLLYALALTPLILFMPLRMVLWAAGAFAVIAISYPILRGGGLVPVDALVTWAYDFDAERGQSLEFRFMNETILLEKANDRPFFGWGTWGRNLIYDLQTGRNISVTDGRWIIVIGMFGWLGYIAEFGLLTFPLLVLALRPVPGGVPVAVAATALILGINLIDMLPNATLLPITWMMAGALVGYAERLASGAAEPGGAMAAPVCTDRKPLQTIL
jgi:hypothetical protein